MTSEKLMPTEPSPSAPSGTSSPSADLAVELRQKLNPHVTCIIGEIDRLLKQGQSADFKDSFNGLRNVQSAAQKMFMLLNAPREEGHTTEFFKKLAFASPPPESELAEKRIAPTKSGSLLLIDDDPANNEVIQMLLEELGYNLESAETGEEGLFLIQSKPFDLILLDLNLPGMNGFDILKCLKDDLELRHIPVLILSGADQTETVIRCIESGAEDFLPKPINPVLLRARIDASLEKKRLRDLEKTYLDQLQIEQEKSEALLLNILPKPIADRLKTGESTIVDAFPEVSVLFSDVVGFTDLSTRISTSELWKMLNEIVSDFDRLAEIHQLEKIKTIGDGYMVVGGLPVPMANHAEAAADMAIDMQKVMSRFNERHGTRLQIRIGINTGPVVAGVIGRKKFIYDLWGDTVNTASRMESHGHPGHIQVTETTYERIKDKFILAKRGSIPVKGKGAMTTYLVMAKNPARIS